VLDVPWCQYMQRWAGGEQLISPPPFCRAFDLARVDLLAAMPLSAIMAEPTIPL